MASRRIRPAETARDNVAGVAAPVKKIDPCWVGQWEVGVLVISIRKELS